jgi:hypothetical protein
MFSYVCLERLFALLRRTGIRSAASHKFLPCHSPSSALSVENALSVNAARLAQRDPPQLQGPDIVDPASWEVARALYPAKAAAGPCIRLARCGLAVWNFTK